MNKFMSFDAKIQEVFDNSVDNYVAFNKLMLDTYNDTLDGISAKDANAKIVEIFRKALGCDENSTKAEVRKAIRRNQIQIFEILEEVIPDVLVSGWQSNPFFMDYVDVRNLALGDKNDFYIDDDSVLTVMKVSGNHHDLMRQRYGAGKNFSLTTEWYGVKIYAEFERMVTNVDKFTTFIGKISEAFDRYIYQALYESLMATGATLGAQWYKSSAINDATAETLRTLCMDVSMATNKEVVIMGTRTALASVTALTNVDWASSEMKNEKYTTGRLGYWEGIRLVELPQMFAKNDTTNYIIDNTKLFIMPVNAENKFLKLIYEGDNQVYQVQDAGTNMDMTYTYEYQTKLGIGVVTNMKWGMWNIIK